MGKLHAESTTDELYVLKRQAIESSFVIVCSGRYMKDEKDIHGELLNEIVEENKRRGIEP